MPDVNEHVRDTGPSDPEGPSDPGTAEEEVARLRAEIANLNERSAQYEGDCMTLRQRVAELEERCRNQGDFITKLQSELSTARAAWGLNDERR